MTEIRDDSISIALDAMGGDSAPDVVIEGANLVLSGVVPCDGKVHFSIYGKKEEVLPVLAKYKLVEANSVFVDVSDAVSSSDRPSYALRHRRRSSMWHAVEDLKKGLVSAVVSAGNTGALMAISRHLLGTIHSIDRPAIAVAMPSQKSSFVVLDIGANIECSADALLQFAIMGVAFAKAILGRTEPKVGLLNVGSEEVKGTYAVQEAFSLMRAAKSKMDFYGYIEAEEVFKGEVDVVVADGFSGNIMLKTTEAVANLLMSLFKGVVKSSITAKIAACMLKPSVRKTMELVDPKLYNGAMLVGLNGVVVKSHGSADGKAYACAIKTAVHSARYAIVSKIASEISEMG